MLYKNWIIVCLHSCAGMHRTFCSILYWCNSKLTVRTGHVSKRTAKGKCAQEIRWWMKGNFCFCSCVFLSWLTCVGILRSRHWAVTSTIVFLLFSLAHSGNQSLGILPVQFECNLTPKLMEMSKINGAKKVRLTPIAVFKWRS